MVTWKTEADSVHLISAFTPHTQDFGGFVQSVGDERGIISITDLSLGS